MKLIFVTGANSMLGTNLIHLLLENGYEVRGLVRNKAKYLGLKHPRLDLVEGDLKGNLASMLEGCYAVIHVAAETRQDLCHYYDYGQLNFHATVNLFDTAEAAQICRFIFVSTANTLGFGSISSPGTEEEKTKPPFEFSFYARSKLEAEKYLIQHKERMEVLMVHPTFMLGAYDSKPSSGKIILLGLKRRIVFLPQGGKNFVHVKDVACGIIKCLELGINGEKYLLANENLTYLEFFKKLSKIAGRRLILISIPSFLLILLGWFGDLIRFFEIRSNISSVNMKILNVRNYYSNAKSISQLDMNYQPIESAITDALSWFGRVES